MRQLKITQSITNRESASFEKYLQDIGKESLITVDEEILLAQKIKQGDEIALDKLIRANLRFVVSVAKQYQNQGLTLPDLINEGNLGLIKAAKRFDETKGFKFISYAVWWIRQSILQALAEQSRIVRLPLNQIGALSKVNKQIIALSQLLEREPTDEEIAAEIDLSAEAVFHIRTNHVKNVVSLDAPIQAGEETTYYEIIENEDSAQADDRLISESLKKDIKHTLDYFVYERKLISERERDVIELFYGLQGGPGLTLEEIGTKFNLTRERIRQMKEVATRKLKTSSQAKNILRSYLG